MNMPLRYIVRGSKHMSTPSTSSPAVTRADVVQALITVGVAPGDTVFAHSSLRAFGHVGGGADTVIDALMEAVGPAGIDLDGADRVGFLSVFRTVLTFLPGRADAADEVDAGIGLRRQFGGLFAIAGAEVLACHGTLRRSRPFLNATNEQFQVRTVAKQAANTDLFYTRSIIPLPDSRPIAFLKPGYSKQVRPSFRLLQGLVSTYKHIFI